MLERLYESFDKLARGHQVFKVETIGDAYMGVCNLDNSQDDEHVKNIAEFAVDAVEAAGQILIDEDDPKKGYIKIRVGFHSGSVVSNVIGKLRRIYCKLHFLSCHRSASLIQLTHHFSSLFFLFLSKGSLNPRYGLFGDAVNTASRMESNSRPGRILCSEDSAKMLMEQAPKMIVRKRGSVQVKGKGQMQTYWVQAPKRREAVAPDLPAMEEEHTETSASAHVDFVDGV